MPLQNWWSYKLSILASLVLATGVLSSPAAAQYKVSPLVSNQSGVAPHTDPNLTNAWGIAYFVGEPFWLSDNGSGKSTLYNAGGVPQSLIVTVPPASGSGAGSPTGIVANGTTDFVVSEAGKSGPGVFLFDTSDGTISGWNPNVNGTKAVIAVNNSSLHSQYTGLAMGVNNGANFLYAADNGSNRRVDMFNAKFARVGSFTDPKIPAAFAPYGIQNINGYLYVTFGSFGTPGGYVDIFNTAGHLVKRFAALGHLNLPWALALAPPDFGQFSNALLVGNLGDGRINAFDFTTGAFLGQLADTTGKTISIDGLWALSFGGGTAADGRTNQLFFTAGPNGYADGLFGVIAFQ